MKSILKDIIHLFFPKVCPGCGGNLLEQEHLICANCILSLEETPFSFGPDNPVMKVFEGRLLLENAGAMYYYSRDTVMQNIVHRIKYNDRKDLALWLGEGMANDLIQSENFADIDLIVPVPLSKSRFKERGFNQSELLAKGMSAVLNVAVDSNLIERKNRSESQTHKNRLERWENVKEDFVLAKSNIEGKHILLIDDVITTGATLEACASKLLNLENCKLSCYSLCLAN